ncbi:ComF family protein [Chondromyces crocatus]|uniref:Phosphoribosyltransferase domain-containing protein n=1 Tax=Chondromyces crocatus TaxID=52 RepID=A0A0K1ERF6_CHOCO|nr:ComF family protein [Chondromyces crocatus]AKT43426.1 uncharacterized protein CMC5_076580 [Chondromyces crocatus]
MRQRPVPPRLASLLSRGFHALLALGAHALSPPTCAACDAPLVTPTDLCPPCVATVRCVTTDSLQDVGLPPTCTPTPLVDTSTLLVAHAAYEGAVAVALRRLKYSNRPDLARPLARMLIQAARSAELRADLIVPVPLHPRRLADRGYNQAALLATHLARDLGTTLMARGLSRLHATPQQARLTREERLRNVAGAFRVRRPADLRDRTVILVDDVATTGATLAACTHALLHAGAVAVTALVVARATTDLRAPPTEISAALRAADAHLDPVHTPRALLSL